MLVKVNLHLTRLKRMKHQNSFNAHSLKYQLQYYLLKSKRSTTGLEWRSNPLLTASVPSSGHLKTVQKVFFSDIPDNHVTFYYMEKKRKKSKLKRHLVLKHVGYSLKKFNLKVKIFKMYINASSLNL